MGAVEITLSDGHPQHALAGPFGTLAVERFGLARIPRFNPTLLIAPVAAQRVTVIARFPHDDAIAASGGARAIHRAIRRELTIRRAASVDAGFASLRAFDHAIATHRRVTVAWFTCTLEPEFELAGGIASIRSLESPVIALLGKRHPAVAALVEGDANLRRVDSRWLAHITGLDEEAVPATSVVVGLISVVARLVVVEHAIAADPETVFGIEVERASRPRVG